MVDKKSYTRLEPQERRTKLLDAGLELAEEHGYNKVTLKMLADVCEVTHGLVTNYFGNAEGMRSAIVRAAVRRENVRVVSQAMALQDNAAINIGETLRKKAIDLLIDQNR